MSLAHLTQHLGIGRTIQRGSYLERTPDPTDGRAKLLMMTDRARAAHAATLQIFADIEAELAAAVGVASCRRR